MNEEEYMQYLENRSQMTESQESYLRHEELKERKNKILMLLNGDLSDEEGQQSGAEEEEEEEEESMEVIGQLN
jgi:uncharacterized alpha/beta hydrolase family protein